MTERFKFTVKSVRHTMDNGRSRARLQLRSPRFSFYQYPADAPKAPGLRSYIAATSSITAALTNNRPLNGSCDGVSTITAGLTVYAYAQINLAGTCVAAASITAALTVSPTGPPPP